MLGSLPPAARKALAAALVILDQGARLYPPSRGRRFARLDDRVAGAYIRALLTRHDVAGEMIRRLKSVVTMCYYELPEVQREIGYDPAPYIAAVSRRRLESYGRQIRAGEAAVVIPGTAPADRRIAKRRPLFRRRADGRLIARWNSCLVPSASSRTATISSVNTAGSGMSMPPRGQSSGWW